MRKQARRLWFGDWQRDDEDPTPSRHAAAGSDQADTVLITPIDDGPAERRAERRRQLKRRIAGGAAIAVLCALIFALFSAGDDNQISSARQETSPAQTPQAQPQAPRFQVPQTPQVPQGAGPPGGFGGPDLTGPAATKAAKAALAKFPGDIERVTAGPGGGGYVVHVIQGDGCEVHVVVSGGFKVLGSDAGANGCGGGAAPAPTPAPQDGSTNQS
jgi:hypothetical protein